MGGEGGEGLGGVEGGKTLIRMYCMQKYFIFNKMGKYFLKNSSSSLPPPLPLPLLPPSVHDPQTFSRIPAYKYNRTMETIS